MAAGPGAARRSAAGGCAPGFCEMVTVKAPVRLGTSAYCGLLRHVGCLGQPPASAGAVHEPESSSFGMVSELLERSRLHSFALALNATAMAPPASLRYRQGRFAPPRLLRLLRLLVYRR